MRTRWRRWLGFNVISAVALSVMAFAMLAGAWGPYGVVAGIGLTVMAVTLWIGLYGPFGKGAGHLTLVACLGAGAVLATAGSMAAARTVPEWMFVGAMGLMAVGSAWEFVTKLRASAARDHGSDAGNV
jgi:hypothetical protein